MSNKSRNIIIVLSVLFIVGFVCFIPRIISNHILDEFVDVNEGIETISSSFSEQNDSLYKLIETENIWKEIRAKGTILKEASDSTVIYIEELKTKLVLLENNGDYEASTSFMIDDKNALQLKSRIKIHETIITTLLNDSIEDLGFIFIKDSIDGEVWEKALFYNIPMIASYTTLSKIISDIRTNEAKCINQLYNSL